jgi:hypothetical protein
VSITPPKIESAQPRGDGHRRHDRLPLSPVELDPLRPRDRAFVIRLLAGDSWRGALHAAGYRPRIPSLTLTAVLGRPAVRAALEALAPLLAVDAQGEQRARELLRPYALSRLAARLGDPTTAGIGAARDLLDVPAAPGPSLRQRAEARAATRNKQGGADNGHYGYSGEGATK